MRGGPVSWEAADGISLPRTVTQSHEKPNNDEFRRVSTLKGAAILDKLTYTSLCYGSKIII
ncbi:hypothetical protein BL250_00200 [Erwinia sp. OLTSP20]|nr:hypothetical protein BV501_00200 [Erwinia sp. OAMSP11]PIJ73541.1 hypothetical protein BK416_06715 [Erwinia sp. OLSSP12]PIJ85358.1 hypothetical protein BLD47_00525 [Erwinia sp. OLCASP19]PIJ87600.1 hypothetical protein BLD46_00200 [Erwinia sp. OLMTSP26]PIJ89107.1 hypothetical protein BLD49_00200 [Erwinia sp. OLMDSP33]PIJ94057.1 hypothetical protein BL249_03245 [Erwinia sp. OLFS4]PIJ95464.1 hypothetical protein BL250_00200 [Erwinia sp. OLTSP20]